MAIHKLILVPIEGESSQHLLVQYLSGDLQCDGQRRVHRPGIRLDVLQGGRADVIALTGAVVHVIAPYEVDPAVQDGSTETA